MMTLHDVAALLNIEPRKLRAMIVTQNPGPCRMVATGRSQQRVAVPPRRPRGLPPRPRRQKYRQAPMSKTAATLILAIATVTALTGCMRRDLGRRPQLELPALDSSHFALADGRWPGTGGRRRQPTRRDRGRDKGRARPSRNPS